MKKNDEARQIFESVVKDYGGPFAVTAKSFLADMKNQPPAPALPPPPPAPSPSPRAPSGAGTVE
jgi:outer membrane protein assembly factor BamD